MRRTRLPSRARDNGFVLMGLLVILTMGMLYFVVSNLTPEAIDVQRRKATESALSRAREALLGYALRYREDQISDGQYDRMYGYLPLPDLGSSRNNNTDPRCKDASNNPLEGCDAAFNTTNHTVIGRFPWRTVGTDALRDGYGECLWYVVSGGHDRIQRPTPMNWDTLGHLDVVVANGSSALVSALAGAHDRPVAIIFSPGPILAGQDRGKLSGTSDNVTQCGGNYSVSNYLDPTAAVALGGTTNYFAGATNQANGDASDVSTPKKLTTQGLVQRVSDGTLVANACASSQACTVAANDIGASITNDALFGALRKSSFFRTDINAMLDRMEGCVRDQIASGSVLAAAKIPANACYDDSKDPLGYFTHYGEQVYVASGSYTATIDNVAGSNCAGTLVLGSQRQSGQSRSTAAEKAIMANYLEAPNLASLGAGTGSLAGHSQFKSLATGQTASQDIVRCIPAGASMVAATDALPAGAEIAQYNAATRTITLGRVNVESDLGYNANALFGCLWTPEFHSTGSGFRSYFRFSILDAGDGFTFVAADGDRNLPNVCGAGEQHLGYSGNNGYTTPISYPKIALEIDTRRNYSLYTTPLPAPPNLVAGFNPSLAGATTLRTLTNGRADPAYAGGHIGIVYWGGDSPFPTGRTCGGFLACHSPSYCSAGACYLNQEEDDNVHGQLAVLPATRPPPRNPVAPVTPPTNPPYPPYGVDKLDPSLSSVPVGVTFHMRVEASRNYAGRDDNSRLVRVVLTSDLSPLSGLPTVDGVVLQANDVVLVTAQSNSALNGIYVASAGSWSRASSADEALEFLPGTSWFVKEGTTHRGSLWRLQNTETPILGVSAVAIQTYRGAVKTVATVNQALSGLSAVNGYTLLSGDRVLLTAQTDPRENGVWAAKAGAWSRASPEDVAAGLKDGALWAVVDGGSTGSYWHLNGDATPGTSNISITQATTNDIYAARLTTQVWKESSNAGQIARMQITTRSMNQLDPVVRHGLCAPSPPLCPTSNPADQYCGGVETDGLRYCYTGQQPKLYDQQKIYDIRGAACGSGASCGSGQFCGVDNFCYQPAMRTTRLGFTTSQSTQSQVISITDFFTTWLP